MRSPTARLRPILAAIPPALRAAAGTLRRSPLRCLILLQGVLWAAVLGILPPAVIRGSREAAIGRARELGADRILAHDGERGGAGWGWTVPGRIRALRWGEVRSVAGFRLDRPLLRTDAASAGDCGRRVTAGRWFTAEEIRSGAPVCLVGAAAARARFGDRPPIGEAISPGEGREDLRVIGVLEILPGGPGALDGFGFKRDHPLHGFIETAKEYLGVGPAEFGWIGEEGLVVAPPPPDPAARLDAIEVRADPTALIEISRSLRRELIGAGLQPLLIANPVVQILFSGQMEKMDRLLRVIFAMCLGTGTIVVANLLILSVLERRKEIALRRVEGATTVSIAVQFIVECGALCLAGGLLGIPVALGLAALRASLDPSGAIHWIFPAPETVRTLVTVTAFGLAGGLLPALRAARIQPAEVLAHE